MMSLFVIVDAIKGIIHANDISHFQNNPLFNGNVLEKMTKLRFFKIDKNFMDKYVFKIIIDISMESSFCQVYPSNLKSFFNSLMNYVQMCICSI